MENILTMGAHVTLKGIWWSLCIYKCCTFEKLCNWRHNSLHNIHYGRMSTDQEQVNYDGHKVHSMISRPYHCLHQGLCQLTYAPCLRDNEYLQGEGGPRQNTTCVTVEE